MTSRRHVYLLFFTAMAMDLAVASGTVAARGLPISSILAHWDSNWFADIVENGRSIIVDEASLSRWAFLPANLLVVGWLSRPLSGVSIYLVGASFSVLMTLLALTLWTSDTLKDFAPKSLWGWALFFFAPGAFFFATFHTEALFLFASMISVFGLARRQVAWSMLGILLAVWTRNQGVILALAVGYAFFVSQQRRQAAAVIAAAAVGLLGLAFYANVFAGTPFAFYRAQSQWPHVTNVQQILGTLFMLNEANPQHFAWWSRTAFAWGWLIIAVISIRSAIKSPHRTPIQFAVVYSVLSFGPMLLQGDFHNVYRFSAVVFPLFVLLSDQLSNARFVTRCAVMIAWLALHMHNVTQYVSDQWAY